MPDAGLTPWDELGVSLYLVMENHGVVLLATQGSPVGWHQPLGNCGALASGLAHILGSGLLGRSGIYQSLSS